MSQPPEESYEVDKVTWATRLVPDERQQKIQQMLDDMDDRERELALAEIETAHRRVAELLVRRVDFVITTELLYGPTVRRSNAALTDALET